MIRFIVTFGSIALALQAAACSCAPNRPHGVDGGPENDAGTIMDANRPPLPDMNVMFPDFGPVVDCMGHDTTIGGTTYAPNGMDPLPGLVVAVFPNDHVFPAQPMSVQCQTCVSGVPGAIAFASAGANGVFSIAGAGTPLNAGGMFTIAVYSGGFRRVVRNVSVPMCGNLMLTAAQTSLPGATMGDNLIPRIAVASAAAGTAAGDVNDKFAHVLDVIGITGYTRFGPDKSMATRTPPMDLITLFSTPATLAQYDVVIAPCGSLGNFSVAATLAPAMVTNLRAWLGMGGRLYASDLSYEVIAQSDPTMINWAAGPSPHAMADPADVGQGGTAAAPLTVMANVDDAGLLAWLRLIGTVAPGGTQIPVTDLKDPWAAIDSVPPANLVADSHGAIHESILVSADVTWHTAPSAHHPLTVQADVADAAGNYCGRAVFSSYHVQSSTTATLSPQERVLEYLFFQLSTCIAIGPT